MPRKKAAARRESESLSRQIAYMEGLEKRMNESIEHKLFEIKVVSYVSLFLAAVLIALVLGILLRASGF